MNEEIIGEDLEVKDTAYYLENKCKGCRYYNTCLQGSMNVSTRAACKEYKKNKKEPAQWNEFSCYKVSDPYSKSQQDRMRLECNTYKGLC